MKISVIMIAAAFEVRMKTGDRILLRQEERFRMAAMLDELDRWTRGSSFAPELLVVTCFDEIAEVCIQRHVRVVRDEFGQISEGGMIRFGILSSPGAEAYMIVSVSEPRLFKAALFEDLCRLYANNPGRIAVTGYKGRQRLPIAFSAALTDPVQSMIDRINGRFILRSNPKNAVTLEITEEDLDRQKEAESADAGAAETLRADVAPDPARAGAVIIRGGGRTGSAIAAALSDAGFRVVITESRQPAALCRSVSFAQAVYDMEHTIGRNTGYLLPPDKTQIGKAWKAGVIPVLIDPELECIRLFTGTDVGGALFSEAEAAALPDPLAYLEGANEDRPGTAEPHDGEGLFAVIDCTPADSGTTFAGIPDDTLTLGIKGHHPPEGGPRYLLDTSVSTRLGVITKGAGIKVVRIDETQHASRERDPAGAQDADDAHEPEEQATPFSAEIFRFVRCPADGTFREIKRIGDPVRVNDILGQIVAHSGKRTDILSDYQGRLAGIPGSGAACMTGSRVAVIDPAALTPEDCMAFSAIDNALGRSVVRMLRENLS